MTFILDTNAISELRKVQAGKGNANVTTWSKRLDVSSCFISVITLMELEIGVSLMEKKDPRQGSILRAWFNQAILLEFKGRVLPVNAAVALHCAKFHVPHPASDRDALIGATALVYQMTVVTRNVSDFKHFGIPIFNPWEDSTCLV